jgi:hypothetical protein
MLKLNRNEQHPLRFRKKQDAAPPLGISIVTDPADLQLIQVTVDDVAQMQQPFDPNMQVTSLVMKLPMFDSGFQFPVGFSCWSLVYLLLDLVGYRTIVVAPSNFCRPSSAPFSPKACGAEGVDYAV